MNGGSSGEPARRGHATARESLMMLQLRAMSHPQFYTEIALELMTLGVAAVRLLAKTPDSDQFTVESSYTLVRTCGARKLGSATLPANTR